MFNIIEKRKIFFAIPAVIILVGLICFIAFGGFNADIDFTGGTAMEIDLGEDFNENAIRDAINPIEGVTVSSVQSTGTQSAMIKTTPIPQEKYEEVQNAVTEAFPDSEIISRDAVSATIGKEMMATVAKAVLVVVILMLIYIWFRFELLSGLSAILALCHDVLIVLSIYAIFQLPINTTFIAAILTVLGYSINATIVVFDRIRENTRLLRKESFENIVNKSIWQTLSRSINTSVTTLITLICLYILGVTSIRQFMMPLIVGVVCGTFSSVFLAGQFWVIFKAKKAK